MRCGSLVVAHDGTSRGDLLLAALLRRDVSAAQVHVVHVLARDLLPFAGFGSTPDTAVRRLDVFHHLRRSLHQGPWSRATIHVVSGDPATRIVEIAQEVGADLVAVGSHGRTGLSRMALGSVAEEVVQRARCPVLVLPDALVADEVAPPEPVEPLVGPELEDHVERIGLQVTRLVADTAGQLIAVDVALPPGSDARAFEAALVRWLALAGISFVDVTIAPGAGREPEFVCARFDQHADPP